ncbi:ABC transporter substrate-binding protein [Phyllobacterium sp.]|uniref:ABC transporter substrate-binding protein n=1 Tax=Phyllobacterium sp. TaxID=1871046 RepID=UPI0030F4AA29
MLRRDRGAIENHLIDGLVDGRIGRREFLRHGSVLGLSLPLLGQIGFAAGLSFTPSLARAEGAPGATIKVACSTPTGAIDPVTVPDVGGLVMISQTGEFLCMDGQDLVLRPMLAESWSSDEKGLVWTFKLRRGVKFHSGAEMTADDVVASIDRLANPKNPSNALSVFAGVLSKGGTRKVDDHTVAFHLDAQNGNFPYLVSSDNYNAIILPAYAGDFEMDFVGTGPFKLETYTPKVGATFVRNEEYWGEKALPARTEFVFFDDVQPQIIALQAGEVDVVNQLPVLASVSLMTNPDVAMLSIKSATHYQVHMRTDVEPFKDPRVRRAVVLAIDRQKLVKGLRRGLATLGNDSPFAPVYPSTDASVPQRAQDLSHAKELLAAAGWKTGTKVTLTTQRFQDIPEYAELIQNAVKEIGIEMDLNIIDSAAYYGDAVYGKSQWLDSPMGITDYGHRGVPNVYLTAPLKSDGTWNSAHFKNKSYDQLVAGYIGALDPDAQKAEAGKIQKLLLEETPVIFGYFLDYLGATRKDVSGVSLTAMGQIFLDRASKG